MTGPRKRTLQLLGLFTLVLTTGGPAHSARYHRHHYGYGPGLRRNYSTSVRRARTHFKQDRKARSARGERANGLVRDVARQNQQFTQATQVSILPVSRGLTTSIIKRYSDPELETRLARIRTWLGTSYGSSPSRAPPPRQLARVRAWLGTSDGASESSATGAAEGAGSGGEPPPEVGEGAPPDSGGPGIRSADSARGWGRERGGPAGLSPAARHQAGLVRDALTARGIRYRWGGASRGGFDCSGFTRYLMARHLGIKLPHSAHAQAHYGQKVSLNELRGGDLVFFRTYRRGISHVGVYVGGNRFIHAPHTGRTVTVQPLTGYYRRRFVTARRLARSA